MSSDGDGLGAWTYAGQPSSTQGVQKINDAADAVLAAFGSGGVSLTDDACDAIINGVKQLQVSVRKALRQSHMLDREPMIGETPAAKVYRPFLPKVATDPVQGFIPAMKALEKKLDDAIAAIGKSRNAMVATDDNARASLPKWA